MTDKEKTSVLFVCSGNSCRSQMAEGLMRHIASARVDVMSAGSHPEAEVARDAIEVMNEIRIDISNQTPKGFDDVKDFKFDWVITLCEHARNFCPVFISKRGHALKEHWPVPDPMTASNEPVESMDAYRAARDDISERIKRWLLDIFRAKF